MVFILYTKASFSTANKRDRAFSQVTNYLAQSGISGDLFVPAQIASVDTWAWKGWPNAMTVSLRFRTQANRDGLWGQLDTYLLQSNQAPTVSYGERFDQALDAPDPDADTTKYNFLSKAWP